MGCHNRDGAIFAGLGGSVWLHDWGFRTDAVGPCYTGANNSPAMPTSINWYGTILAGPEGLSELGLPIGAGGVLGMPRSDGLTDGFETIQGARTYDSTAAAWTTPDAYAGDARDPGSQKSYVWNRNNPVSFSDPAGYDYTSAGTDGSGATNDNAQSLFTDWSATGETEQIVANKYFTSEDAEHAVEGGYATTVVELKGNLDPKNYSDLSHLANNVRDALTKSKLGAWSLISDRGGLG